MASPDLQVIDFHTHYIDPSWTLTTAATGSAQARRHWQSINQRLSDRRALVADIESGDLAARIVNSPSAFIEGPDGSLPADAYTRLNDQLAAVTRDHPGVLYGLATVDAFGGDAAARELERAVSALGLRGVFAESARGDLLLDAPQARPVLAAAARLGVPVFVHPINPQPLTTQLAPYGRLGTLLARGTVNSATLVALLAGGVLEQLPGLNIVVTTLALGSVLLSSTFGARDDGPGAADLLRRQVYIDTMGFNPVLIRALADTLGADHILAGSDWPIVSQGPIKPRLAHALDQAGFDTADQQRIAGGNILRLIGADRRDAAAA